MEEVLISFIEKFPATSKCYSYPMNSSNRVAPTASFSLISKNMDANNQANAADDTAPTALQLAQQRALLGMWSPEMVKQNCQSLSLLHLAATLGYTKLVVY